MFSFEDCPNVVMIPHTFELYRNALAQGIDTEPRGFITLFLYEMNAVIFSSVVFPQCSLTQFLTPRVPVTQKTRKRPRAFLKRLHILTEVISKRTKKLGAFHIRVETDPLSKTLWSLQFQMMDKVKKLSNMKNFQDYHTSSISKVIILFFISKFPLPKVILKVCINILILYTFLIVWKLEWGGGIPVLLQFE
jgi:hypothetical protein